MVLDYNLNMLARNERLKRSDFSRFFESGRRYHTPYFTVVHTPYPTFHGSVVISKKVAARAVTRNALRRRLYDMLRTLAHSGAISGIVIVLVKKEGRAASAPELREALVRVFGTIGKSR